MANPFFSPFGGTANPSGSSPGFGAANIQAFGAGVSDIFAGFAAGYKIQADVLEGQAYSEAATLARQNEQFTAMSTAIQEAQSNRQSLLATGRIQAEEAGAGFSLSGNALDIMRSSASQGALQTAVIGQQGLITEAGYEEQARSYDTMAKVANAAAQGEKTAQIGDFIAGGISLLAAL